jgi:hypothetical protein
VQSRAPCAVSGGIIGVIVLTPGVGLMTTVGGNLELTFPPFGLEAPPMGPNRSGRLACWPGFEGWFGTPWSPWPVVLFGSGLLRMSLRVVEEEVGVKTGDWLDESLDEGDDVPSLESLFFLEDLLASLPRASCWSGESVSTRLRRRRVIITRPGRRHQQTTDGG